MHTNDFKSRDELLDFPDDKAKWLRKEIVRRTPFFQSSLEQHPIMSTSQDAPLASWGGMLMSRGRG
jgi:hypothetical protein